MLNTVFGINVLDTLFATHFFPTVFRYSCSPIFCGGSSKAGFRGLDHGYLEPAQGFRRYRPWTLPIVQGLVHPLHLPMFPVTRV